MFMKSTTDQFGRVRRHEFEVLFNQEERFWLDRHHCYTETVVAESRKDSEEMTFVLYSGKSFLQIRCKPEEFFTALEKEISQVPYRAFEVKASLPGMSDEEFV